jgi:uncharacterized protein YndB with AHSA1/START domain
MGHVEVARTLNAPVQAVWDCLNDIEHTPEWVTGLEAAEIKTSGPYGAGSVYHDHNRLGPFPQETPWYVTVFEPMTRQVHESRSPVLPSTMTLALTPDAGGTHLSFTVDYRFLPRLGPVSGLFERVVMNRMLGQVLKQNLAGLDAYLRKKEA